ncbi:ABC transporter permease [Sediminivirga luteola]|uniref:ABC transporter permease n=1 Tax=Sediminivirga luteola TaxID=1774748 RepID=A0A8J2XJP0_9MICO|nr:ABC transporter permease [Sediminivirga luteola]GGA07223.1 ABC transporter permease [Sediminivirga luteola]
MTTFIPGPRGQGAEQPGDSQDSIETKDIAGLSQGQIVLRRFLRHKGALVGLITIACIALFCYSAVGVGPIPGWWQYNHYSSNPVLNPQGAPTMSLPAWLGGDGFAIGQHPFGQDDIGRDNFARVMKGTQISLMVMVVIGVVGLVIGSVIGALAGFYRGWLDNVLMRITDGFIILPTLVVGAILGKMVGGASAIALALALGLILWPTLARLVRGEFLGLREREFVDAARVTGASDLRIMLKHMFPNSMGVIIVNTSLLMAQAIVLETALSFLGFGITSPDVSLGQLINEYQSSFATRPWLFWWPGLFIIVIALCINFVGDGLRDAFDPRQKRVPSKRVMDRAARRNAKTAGDAAGKGAAS